MRFAASLLYISALIFPAAVGSAASGAIYVPAISKDWLLDACTRSLRPGDLWPRQVNHAACTGYIGAVADSMVAAGDRLCLPKAFAGGSELPKALLDYSRIARGRDSGSALSLAKGALGWRFGCG